MRSKAPPKVLLDQLKAGYVCEITNSRGAHEPQITFIPLAEAEDMFFQRFGRALLDVRPVNIQPEACPNHPQSVWHSRMLATNAAAFVSVT
jgi:hypothetical protein